MTQSGSPGLPGFATAVLERHRTICGTCGLVMVRMVAPTLAATTFFGECVNCGRKTMQRDMGGELPPDVSPLRAPEPPPPLEPDGEPALDGDPAICPECGEAFLHDADCPFPGRLHQAYLRWRATDDGKIVVDAVRTLALDLARRGWSHYGIQAIAEVVRFHRALEVGPSADGFKVNNSYLSRLARDLMREDPDGPLRDFFEVRALRPER